MRSASSSPGSADGAVVTYLAEACACCASPSSSSTAYPAIIAPFLLAYAIDKEIGTTRLLECRECKFRYFEDRLTNDEAARLYSGYRGDRYFRARHTYEPWYTRKLNDGMGEAPEMIRVRRALVESFLREHLAVTNLRDVLDFGGDRGQLIPEIGERRFVYEISGLAPVAGVAAIESEAALAGQTFDLVLLSHVLEHCSEPQDVLAQVRPLLAKGSSLYVELPYERATLTWLGRSRAYGKYLERLSHAGPLLTAMDLFSTAVRIKLDTVPPLGFVKMHEHLNFFDEASLGRLLERAGFTTIALERKAIVTSLGSTPVLSALARLAT